MYANPGTPLWFVPKGSGLQNVSPFFGYANSYLGQSQVNLESYVRQRNLYSLTRHREGRGLVRDPWRFGVVYCAGDKSWGDWVRFFYLPECSAQACEQSLFSKALSQIPEYFGLIKGRPTAFQRSLESISEELQQIYGRVVGVCRRAEEDFGEGYFKTFEGEALKEFMNAL